MHQRGICRNVLTRLRFGLVWDKEVALSNYLGCLNRDEQKRIFSRDRQGSDGSGKP